MKRSQGFKFSKPSDSFSGAPGTNTLHKGLPDDKLAALLLYYYLKKPLSKVIHPTHE